MRIDVHSHLIPKETVRRLEGLGVSLSDAGGGRYSLRIGERSVGPLPPGALNTSDRIREMDRLGIDIQVVSPTHHLFMYRAEIGAARAAARVQNEGIAEAVKASGGRLLGNATLPLQDKEAALEELRYAVDVLGLSGIEIGTNIGGRNLDDESLYPIYERAEDLGMPIFIHPNDIMAPDRHKKYYSPIVVGTLAETTLAITSIVFGGILDRFPRLRLIFSHGGAAVPYQAGRLEHASRVREECRGLKRSVSEYLKTLYYDSVLFKREALEYLVREVSASQVLLGTDYPFNMGDPDAHRLVESLGGLSRGEREMILAENARRLYRL